MQLIYNHVGMSSTQIRSWLDESRFYLRFGICDRGKVSSWRILVTLCRPPGDLTVRSLVVLQSSFNFVSESCTSLAMSTSQPKTKSSLSLLLSSTKRLLATRFQLKSGTSSTQPRPTHNPPPNVAVANSTLSQQNCGDVVNDSDMAPRSSEDSARRIASGKTNAPYESSARWV